MLIGYARVSTDEQNLDAQVVELRAAGCERVIEEKASGKTLEDRPALQSIMSVWLGKGDTLIVTKLDRLSRRTIDMLTLVEEIGKLGAGFRSLAEPWADTTSPAGGLMLTIFAGVAEFERNRMLERQRAGIERARAEGKYAGRPKTFDAGEIRSLHRQGVGPAQIARSLKCDRATVYRAINANGKG